MKKTLLILIFLVVVMHVTFAQCGFVAVAYDDAATRSTASLGQMFDYGVASSKGYANEGLQQSFLYHGSDTLLYENSSYPVAYRPADRNPEGIAYRINVGYTPQLYLLPTHGLDSLIDVMAYGVTFTNDTTVVAPYNVCEYNFDLYQPLVLPEGSVPPVQYYSEPATYPVGVVTPVNWYFSVADKSLTDIQQVNVKFPPCGTDNFNTDIANYPYTATLPEPFKAVDYEGNSYNTVRVGCQCWTKENLQSTKYFDGEDIANPMAYVSDDYSNAAANVALYGYLYTWPDAVHAPLASDAAGNVQGICPDGWHLPTALEFATLTNYPSFDLMSDILWLSGEGTNATGYSALPAGKHTGLRFENLLGETHFWTATSESATTASYFSIRYGCSELLHLDGNKVNGKSVRCLKD